MGHEKDFKRCDALELECQDQVAVRHCSRTKYLGVMNTMITEEQKCCIQATTFAWMSSLGKTLKMSKTLLRELCFIWVERRGGFWI